MVMVQTKFLMNLSFLKPLALHKVSALQRALSSAALSVSTSTTTFSPAQRTASAIESTPKRQISRLPYRVERTSSFKLPIYVQAKSGGTRKETKLRKIEGDIDALRVQLRDALRVNDKDIVINRLTNHIIIKGWRKLDVAKFLEEQQF